jgi:hypothetical protein
MDCITKSAKSFWQACRDGFYFDQRFPSRHLSYVPSLLRREFVCARSTAALAAQPAHLDGCRIPIVWIAILGLTCSDVTDKLGKRNRVAGALLASFSYDLLSHTRTADARQIQERQISN